jgi:hypothetical protein
MKTMKSPSLLITLSLSISLLTACSSRHISDQYFGSTEQRLVTHSINTLIQDLPVDLLADITHQTVYLESWFLTDNAVSKYAHERFSMELSQRFNATVTPHKEQANFEVKVFFTSIGTNRDNTGFTIPLLYLPRENIQTQAEIPLVAIDMYHGISEMYFYLTDLKNGKIRKSPRYKATTKTDRIATPFFSFPINHLK